MVRLGKFGEMETRALESDELVTGWQVGDLTPTKSRADILRLLEDAYPDEKSGTLQNWSVQLNQFRNDMAVGDLVVVPLKTTGQIAVGTVVGDYLHADGAHPARRVKWLVTDLPRDAVKQDLLYSLGATQTVCGISRNDAVVRFASIAKTRRDPGPGGRIAIKAAVAAAPAEASSESIAPSAGLVEEGPVDLAVAARDQLERYVQANFAGHAFTELVAAVLRCQGYQARVSPPGADRGIDIVAGQGPLGFGAPTLVVQVKSGSVVVDQPTIQSLLGCITDAHADHGLIVSWSGINSTVRQRLNELYFRVRVWGREEFLQALLAVYEQLPDEIRAELPLQRIWVLVPDDRLDM
jgi:restriction system protein